MPVQIAIEGHGGRVVVVVLGYENPSAPNTSDANWLSCEVSVKLGGWEGAVRASLTTEDFAALAKDLRAVFDGAATVATFDTMEEALALRFEMARTGSCRVTGTVRDRSNPEVKLSFVLQSDQTYLRPALASIEQVVASFPVR